MAFRVSLVLAVALGAAAAAGAPSPVERDLDALEADLRAAQATGPSDAFLGLGPRKSMHGRDLTRPSRSAPGSGAHPIGADIRREADEIWRKAAEKRREEEGRAVPGKNAEKDTVRPALLPAGDQALADGGGKGEIKLRRFVGAIEETILGSLSAGMRRTPCADFACFEEQLRSLQGATDEEISDEGRRSSDGFHVDDVAAFDLKLVNKLHSLNEAAFAAAMNGRRGGGGGEDDCDSGNCAAGASALNMLRSFAVDGDGGSRIAKHNVKDKDGREEMISRDRGTEGSGSGPVGGDGAGGLIDGAGGPDARGRLSESGDVATLTLAQVGGGATRETRSTSRTARTPNLGMGKDAFKDRMLGLLKGLARNIPEIFYIGGGANFNVLNGAVEAAVDFETYETALFAQGGVALGTDLVSVIGANAVAGAAWKRSKGGETIEEYGGKGVSLEIGGDVAVTVSVAMEIDADDRFAPEWGGVLKVGGDVGIDFGVPTVVSVNVGASEAGMVRKTKSCCKTRRCLAYKIFLMPGTWAMKAPAYAALAYYDPPTKNWC